MQSQQSGRLHYLDGLRGWAALAVVIFHASWKLFEDFLPVVRVRELSLVNDGLLAVFVFFVLSGVVLTQASLRPGQTDRIKKMAIARYPRLAVPVIAASLIGLVLMSCGLLFNNEAMQVLGPQGMLGRAYGQSPSVLAWARFSLYDVFFNYDESRAYGMFLWTMPFEMGGSFLLFGIVAVAGESRAARCLFYAVGAVLTWELQPILSPFVYGVILAELMTSALYDRVSRGVVGNVLGATLFTSACIASTVFRPGYNAHKCGVLAVAVVLGVMLSPSLRWFFQTAPSRLLGRLSFPMYLVHGLVICSLSCRMILLLNASGWTRAEIAAFVVPATVALSLVAAWMFSPFEKAAIAASNWFAAATLDGFRRADGAGVPASAPLPT